MPHFTKPIFGPDEEIFSMRQIYEIMTAAKVDPMTVILALEKYGYDCFELRAEHDAQYLEATNVS